MERELIGRYLIDNNALVDSRLSVKHFTDPLCREVRRVIDEVLTAGEEANLLTVCDKSAVLQKRAGELSEMTTNALIGPIGYAEKKVLTEYQRKALRLLAAEIKDREPEDALEYIDDQLSEITAETERDRIWSSGELVPGMIKRLEDRYHGRIEAGISTGFPAVDEIIGGFAERLFYLFAARPSDGKSAILLNMAIHAAGTHSVGYITAESSKEETMMRALSNVASLDSRRVRTGMLKERDFVDVAQGADQLSKARLYFYDQPNVPLTRLITVAKLMARKHKIDILFIDYVQQITPANRGIKRNEQVAEISSRLKQLGRELGVPVVAAAQLTRDAQGRRPVLSDLAESGQLERDADTVCLLHHERDDKGETTRVWGHFDKVRDGARGSVKLQFIGRYIRFAEEALYE